MDSAEPKTVDPVGPNLMNFNFSTVLDKNYEQLQRFLTVIDSIEWTEPWLLGLIAFHVLVTLLTLLTRKRPAAQAVMFLTLLALVAASESLNNLAAENWKLYSKQQYFDSDGMFISLVFSAPLLFNCLLMVANWLFESSELMTSLRRFQLQQNMKKKKADVVESVSAKSTSTMTLRSRARKE